MNARRTVLVVGLLLAAALGGAVAVEGILTAPPDDEYERATVHVVDGDTDRELATVDVRVADTFDKRYTGLSETESLGEDEGMLFVHDQPGEHTYVMREMDFPLDIVFVSANGTITEIHHAPVEEDQSDLTGYSGQGLYVLEVPMHYTDENCIEVGDRIRIEGYDGDGNASD